MTILARTIVHAAAVWVLTTACMAGILIHARSTWAQSPQKEPAANWVDQKAIRVLNEAITQLGRHSLVPRPPDAVVKGCLTAYMRANDPYGDYLSAPEYAAWRKAQAYRFYGVGMDLVRRSNGDTICIPQPEGPAARAGIQAGTVLVAVDGVAVKNTSLYVVGARIRGPDGSDVRLSVIGPGEAVARTLTLRREPVESRSVWVKERPHFLLLRITNFNAHTPREMAEVLRSGLARPKVIDLRGNVGGDLFAAVDTAGLLLPAGAEVVTLKTRSGSTIYRAQGPSLDQGSQLFILQDQDTASAAEVFTAALVRHERAVSLGQISFGKGVAQRVLELSDGSALIVTYAELLPPGGKPYTGTGLAPTHHLPVRPASDDDSWRVLVERLLPNDAR